jgi:GxxExxY protein
MNTDAGEQKQLTRRVIGCAYQVANTLGNGFLEKVYENALAHELAKAGLSVSQQVPIAVIYDGIVVGGIVVGDFFADSLVEKTLLLELKSATALSDAHFAQCLNYLKATGMPVCLLLNFGTSRMEIRRVMLNR